MNRKMIVAAAVVAGSLAIAGVALAGDADGGPEPPMVYSYDHSDNVARVFAYCIGVNGVYMVGNTDQFWVLQEDVNCGEGGFLSGS